MSFYDLQSCSCTHPRHQHDSWDRCVQCACRQFMPHEKHFRNDPDAWKQKELFDD